MSEIKVVEPYYYNDLTVAQQLVLVSGKQLITNEGYVPMDIGDKYLLFLELNN